MLFLLISGCSLTPTEHTAKLINIEEKEEPPIDFMPRSLTIVSIGDSLTKGVGDSKNEGGYNPYLKTKLEAMENIKEVTIENYGVSGNRSDQLMDRLQEDDVKKAVKRADIVIMTIGGNDIMEIFRDNFANLHLALFDQAKAEYKERLKMILQTVNQENPSARIILVGIYNPFTKWFANIEELNHIIHEWNEMSKQLVTQVDGEFVPIADIFEQEEDLLHTDYFHPNDRGYELIAERLFEQITTKNE